MTDSERIRIDQLTVGQLISAMKVSHLWAIIGAIATLLAGVFVLGYRVAGIQSDRATSVAAMSEMEYEFVTRYLRYMTAKEDHELEPDEESQQRLETAESLFVDLIARWWDDQQDFEGDIVLKPQIIRKGFDPTNSRIEFNGTVWPIPPEIKRQVLE